MITDALADPGGPRILYINSAFTRLTGYDSSEALGHTPRILHGSKTDRFVLQRMAARLRQGLTFSAETINYRKDGRTFINRWHASPLVDDDGHPTHVLHIQRDVTSDRRAQRSAKRLETVVESLENGVLIIDDRHFVKYVNRALSALVGMNADKFVGRHISRLPINLVTGKEGFAALLNGIGARGAWRGDLELITAEGRRTTLASVVTKVIFDGGVHSDGPTGSAGGGANYVVVGTNVTQQRRLEVIASALNMTENTGYIFAGIRHELGNPVNSLKTALTVVRNNFHEYSPDKLIDYLDRMMDEIGRIEYLLGALRTVNPSSRLSLSRVDLKKFIGRFLPLVKRGLLNRRSITFDVVFKEDQVSIRADPRALHQVLLNVISNAIDAVSGPEAHIELGVAAMCAEVEIAITDNGCGMTTDQKSCLFKPFHTSKNNGTGLGLVITQRLVAQMNGTMSVSSQLGAGTRVVMSFEQS